MDRRAISSHRYSSGRSKAILIYETTMWHNDHLILWSSGYGMLLSAVGDHLSTFQLEYDIPSQLFCGSDALEVVLPLEVVMDEL